MADTSDTTPPPADDPVDDGSDAGEGGPAELPSPEDQCKMVKDLLNASSYNTGDSWFLVLYKWMNAWKTYAGFHATSAFGANQDTTYEPGTLSNSYLLSPTTGKLKPYLMEDIDYAIVPEGVWRLFQQWYGAQPEIKRKVIETGAMKTKVVEVYPFNLRIQAATNNKVYNVTASKSSTIGALKSKLCKKLAVGGDAEEGYPDARLRDQYYRNQDLKEEQTLEEARVINNQRLMLEVKGEDGEWPAAATRTAARTGGGYSGAYSSNAYASRGTSSVYGSSRYGGGGAGGGRGYTGTKVENGTPGLCGLNNLGNTCFMNSALQCVSNVPELTQYFMDETYKAELNPTNPLGMEGKVAQAYADLNARVWSGEYSSVPPRDFKWTIGRFAPQFVGFGQQDSQELLSFLLDGMHEDLNRVLDKPYVESTEAAGRPDEVVASEAWENHKLRNDSIVVDLFQGQFKSTVVCPEPDCDRVSVTFDPFMYVSVPLPDNGLHAVNVIFVPLDPTVPPTKMLLPFAKKDEIKTLKAAVAEAQGVASTDLVCQEIYQHKVYKTFHDRSRVVDVDDDEVVTVYEAPLPAGFCALSVVNRIPNATKSTMGTYSYAKFVGTPTLVVTSATATTYAGLRETIIERMQRYVTMPADDEANPVFTIKKSINGGRTVANLNATDDVTPLQFYRNTTIVLDWDKDRFEAAWNQEAFDEMNDERPEAQEGEESNVTTLYDCLNVFTTSEQLSEENPWYCSQCQELRRGHKQMQIWKTANVLIFHLKRFSQTRFRREKLNLHVDFPLEGLDIAEHVVGPKNDGCLYDLFAVSNHFGGMGGGHYTAYAKNKDDGKWYDFNDSSVGPVTDESRIVSSAAYLLFYKRRGAEGSASVNVEVDEGEDAPVASTSTADVDPEAEAAADDDATDDAADAADAADDN